MGHSQWQVHGEVGPCYSNCDSSSSRPIPPFQVCPAVVFTEFIYFFAPLRQHKLEEALLFSGRFTDALQALNDWLYRAEPQLTDDVPVGGDKDMVHNLIDKHKVVMSQVVIEMIY